MTRLAGYDVAVQQNGREPLIGKSLSCSSRRRALIACFLAVSCAGVQGLPSRDSFRVRGELFQARFRRGVGSSLAEPS